MPRKSIIFLLMFVLATLAYGQTTIHDIQYTTEAGSDNTYPSTMVGQEVTINMAVIMKSNFNNNPNNAFVCDVAGGAWSGIYLPDADLASANDFDRVKVVGTVQEQNGMTILANAVLSEPAPFGCNITMLNSFDNPESYESCYVKLKNVKVVAINDDNISVLEDTQGNKVLLGNGFVDATAEMGSLWKSITGIVSYENDQFIINPLTLDDLEAATLTMDYEKIGSKVYASLYYNGLKSSDEANAFEFMVNFPKRYSKFLFVKTEGSLISDETNIEINGEPESGSFKISYQQDDYFATSSKALVATVVFDLLLDYTNVSYSFSNFKLLHNDNAIFTNLEPLSINFSNEYKKSSAYLSIFNKNNRKNIFDPRMNESISIQYGTKGGSNIKAIIRIYDLQGRLVYTPVNKNSSGLAVYRWNGRDRNRNLVDIGTYICQLEITDRRTGKTHITDQPIVVAGQLD